MTDRENIVPLSGEQQIETEAANWFVLMERDTIRSEDRIEFDRWIAQSERHRRAYEALAGLWDDMAVLKELDDIAESVIELNDTATTFWQRRSVIAVAASVILCVFTAAFMFLQPANTLNQQDLFITEIGEQRTIELIDGSTLEMNTNSRIEVDFTNVERKVHLMQGEVYFSVAEDKRRAFSVYAGTSIVKAVGTAFTVRLRIEDAVEVTVEEGRVMLTAKDSPGMGSEGSVVSDRPILAELTAGQSTIFSQQVEQISQMQTPELKRKLAWRQGMLAYSNDPLLKVVEDVSRYTDIEIEITDSELRNLPIAGYFKVGETEALLESLEYTFGLSVQRVDEKRVQLSSRR